MARKTEIRNHESVVLSDDWSVLTKHTFDLKKRDGTWERQVRQTYDRGNGAAILPYDPVRGTVLLVRQFRMPAHVTGHHETLIEACAGLLDDLDPLSAIAKEAEEELGYRIHNTRQLFDIYMSPGSVTERLHLFTGTYAPDDRISAGGGAADEGEDIEVMEVPLAQASAMIADGRIIDAKTVILIQALLLSAAK